MPTHKSKHWTESEDGFLMESFYTLEWDKILESLSKRSEKAIIKRIVKLNLNFKKRHLKFPPRPEQLIRWTEEDDRTLRLEWKRKTPEEIAKLMNRTIRAIRFRANLLKLGRKFGRPPQLFFNSAKTPHGEQGVKYKLFFGAKARAKKAGLDFNLTLDDIIVPEVCPLLNIPIFQSLRKTSPNSPSLDRINSHNGYVKGNVWVVSHKANRLKSDASREELKLLTDNLEKNVNFNISSITGFKKYKILVIGEVCKDVWVEGVTRESSESVSLVLLPKKITTNGGMAANTKNNFKSLSPDSEVVLISNLNEITKTRYVDEENGAILLRIDENDYVTNNLTLSSLLNQINFLGKNILDFDAVVFSDYNKGFILEHDMKEIIDYLQQNKILTFVDSKKRDVSCFINSNFVKINEKEYRESNIKNFEGKTNLIVTKGKYGCVHINTKESVLAPIVNGANVCGCGDTFFSAFVLAYLETKNILRSMKYATFAASLKSKFKNVYCPSHEEVVSFSKTNGSDANKIIH